MNNIGAIFVGQGSQYSGMGLKLRNYPSGKETFKEANHALGIDIESLCCNGTDDELVDTEITQPAIVTCSIAVFRILMRGEVNIPEFASVSVSATAGLSVGEYSALVASETLSFTDALKLVKQRGRLMAEAGRINPGTMTAVIGLDAEKVRIACKEASSYGVVQPANYNCPGQIVISGEKQAVQMASELAQKAGAKRCIPLDVSGAFHSPLMRSAETGLNLALSEVSFSKPGIPFVANVTGNYIQDPEEIKESLALQLTSSIQWEASVSKMVEDGLTTFVEFGPGKVLSGLVKKINKEVKVFSSEGWLKNN
jgi:[acyl-carrier-protein] S-malonyltransferase